MGDTWEGMSVGNPSHSGWGLQGTGQKDMQDHPGLSAITGEEGIEGSKVLYTGGSEEALRVELF